MTDRTAILAPFLGRWQPPVTYSAEAEGLFARMTSQPDATRKGLIDTAITSLKTAGVWAKLEALWIPAAPDAQAAALNWRSSSFNLTAVGSPTFTADRGYAGNGSTSYLNTGLTPSTAPIVSLNSFAMGIWLNAGTDTASDSIAAMGANDANGTFLIPRRLTGAALGGRINSSAATATFVSVSTRLGFSALSRTGSTTTTGYRNSGSGTSSAASSALPAWPIYLGGNNANGTFTSAVDNRIAAAFVASGLNATEIGNLYNSLNTFLTAIGAA